MSFLSEFDCIVQFSSHRVEMENFEKQKQLPLKKQTNHLLNLQGGKKAKILDTTTKT